jgi:hypothetical protein
MPANIDIPEEIAYTQSLLNAGSVVKQQIVTRIPPQIYLAHLQACSRSGKLAGPLACDVLTEYYSSWARGVHLVLPEMIRQITDRIGYILGVDREVVVLRVLEQYLASFLAEVAKSQVALQESLTASSTAPLSRVCGK